MTSKDSDQHEHPPSIARIFMYPSLNSLETLEGRCGGWSKSSLVGQVLLQILLCAGSYGSWCIAPEKRGYQHKIFSYFFMKNMLWVLNRSTLSLSVHFFSLLHKNVIVLWVLVKSNLLRHFFLFLQDNICCGYSLEVPRQGTSNEYPQHMFLWRICLELCVIWRSLDMACTYYPVLVKLY